MNKDAWELYSQILSKDSISLIYSKDATTAFFNLENRTITVPIFEYMTDDVTQLFISHEVGHACYSTYSKDEFNKYINTYGDLFNIFEDIHIENRLKSNFNGLNNIFLNGYKTLYEKNFFELDNVDISELPFISRINLYFKIGFVVDIPFNKFESKMILKLKKIKSKNDVIKLCEEFKEYILQLKDKDTTLKNSMTNTSQDFIKKYLTDHISFIFNENVKKYGQEKINNSSNELYEPTLTLSTIESYKNIVYYNYISNLDPSFLRKNRSAIKKIKLIAKDISTVFQCKKSAIQQRNVKNIQTGSLDLKKISKYKISDNIFLKKTIQKHGKNHGIVILIDFSWSMEKYIRDILLQACVLGEFCKINDIPFVILAFGIELKNIQRKHCVVVLANNEYFSIENILFLSENRTNNIYSNLETFTVDGLLVSTYIIKEFKSCGVDKTSLFIITDGLYTNSVIKNNIVTKFSPYTTSSIVIDNIKYSICDYIEKYKLMTTNWIIELICLNLKRYNVYISFNMICDYNYIIHNYISNFMLETFPCFSNIERTSKVEELDDYMYLWKHGYYFENKNKIPSELKKGILSYNFKNNPFIDQFQIFDLCFMKKSVQDISYFKKLKHFAYNFIEHFA